MHIQRLEEEVVLLRGQLEASRRQQLQVATPRVMGGPLPVFAFQVQNAFDVQRLCGMCTLQQYDPPKYNPWGIILSPKISGRGGYIWGAFIAWIFFGI